MAVLVEYSQKLQQAVDRVIAPLGYTEHSGSRQRGRSTFTDRRGGYGGDNDGYSGPFAFSFNEAGNLVISPGFLNRNGDFIEIEEQIVEPQTGYVCLESKLIAKEGAANTDAKEWSQPAIVFLEKPTATAYPLGYCTVENEIAKADCYEVQVAFILATRQCPLAGGK